MVQRRVRGNSLYGKDSESGEELNDVLFWKEDGGLEYTVGEKLCTEQRRQLEVMLQEQSTRICSRVNLGKPKPSSTLNTLLIAET